MKVAGSCGNLSNLLIGKVSPVTHEVGPFYWEVGPKTHKWIAMGLGALPASRVGHGNKRFDTYPFG